MKYFLSIIFLHIFSHIFSNKLNSSFLSDSNENIFVINLNETMKFNPSSVPFFIALPYQISQNGYGVSFDMNYTSNYKSCQERLLPQSYNRIALFNNPIIVNGSVMSDEEFYKEKSVNFSGTNFNIPGIYDSELQYGSIFFSIKNVTNIGSNSNFLVVKIDISSNPECFDYQGLWVEAWSSYLYSNNIQPFANDYISNHIFEEEGQLYNATYRFPRANLGYKYLFIEFSPRSDNLKYVIENDTSTGRYPVYISESYKKTVLGRKVFQLDISKLNQNDTVNFTVYINKSVTDAFPDYYQLLLEDYTIYHEYYYDDEDFYDYDTKGELTYLDDQDDDMKKSFLLLNVPTVKEISKITGNYTVLQGDYYFKIYRLDITFWYYGLYNFMDNVNPQIIKPFYIEKKSNITSDYFYLTFQNFLETNQTEYYFFDIVFISGNDYYKYPMYNFIFEKMGEVRPLTTDILYTIYDPQSLYRHFKNEKLNTGTINFIAADNVTNPYIAIYARYYNDTEGPIKLKVYNEDKSTIIYGDTEIQNAVYIPYEIYHKNKLYMDVACVKTCNITLDNWLLDNISDYYDGFFYGTFKVPEDGKITYYSKYFRLHMSLFIFTDKDHPTVSINGVEIKDPIRNDFFLSTYVNLSAYKEIITDTWLKVELEAKENTNISIFQNYEGSPNNWFIGQFFENSTPSIFDYFNNERCQLVYIHPNMGNNYLFRFMSDSFLNLKFENGKEFLIQPQQSLILNYSDINVEGIQFRYCLTTKVKNANATYSLQIISNTDQTTSNAAVDPLYLNVYYYDNLLNGGIRVYTLGELTLDKKRYQFYNYKVVNKNYNNTKIKVYYTRCETYPVCTYNKDTLESLYEITGKNGEYLKSVSTNLITTLHPDENYVMIVYCNNQKNDGCSYDILMSEDYLEIEYFTDDPIELNANNEFLHHYSTNNDYGILYFNVKNSGNKNYLIFNVQLFSNIYRENNMIKLYNSLGTRIVYPNWNNGSVLYVPKNMFSANSFLMLVNQCIGECDIFVEAVFKDDLNDEFIVNTFTTLPEKFIYNSYKYKENTDLYVFTQTNRLIVKIFNDIVVGVYSKFFKLRYIDLNSYSSLSDEYLPISITSSSDDEITVYQKNNQVINEYFYNSKYSSPVDYKFVDGTATETVYCPKYLNDKYAIHVLSDNDLTFTFNTKNKNSVIKEVKAQTGAVFTYDNGVDYSGDGYFTYTVTSSKMTFYSIQILSNFDQKVSKSPAYPLKLGVRYEDYLTDESIRVFKLGELVKDSKNNYYQFNVTNSNKDETTLNVWLEKCVNYPICNISYESILSEKTAIEFLDDGNNFYQQIKKKKIDDINSYANYVLTIYCKSKTSKKGCYYNFGVNDVFIDDGSGSESSGENEPKNKSNVLTIIIIIIVVIIFSGILYFIYLKKFKKNSIQEQIENLNNLGNINSQQFTEEES